MVERKVSAEQTLFVLRRTSAKQTFFFKDGQRRVRKRAL